MVRALKSLDKYRGCLIGGAAGDALGYAVEFLSGEQVFKKYGEKGITEYSLIDGVAQISDDTQMTLFTANGLLLGTTRGMTRGIMGTYPSYISLCYKEWLRTQTEKFPLNEKYPYTWLINVPELFSPRAPGNTCLSAIEASLKGNVGTIQEPINKSKGCGGVMRVAPIGLYFGDKKIENYDVDMIGAETAALTHGHELGYFPAAALVHIIHLISHNDDISLLDAVNDSILAVRRMFAPAEHLSEFIGIMEKAIKLSKEDIDDLDAIRELGEGWVAEETLAIAVYCALKYEKDFDKALIAAVNHSGDSDSTGAVTGNILGAYLGMSAIPQKYLDNLELKDVILEIADDLFNDCKISEYGSYHDEIWEQKYIDKTYTPKKKEEPTTPDSCTIVLFPEFVTLKAEVEKLRTEISMLLLERDELRLVVCKNIETAYMLALGSLEYKAFELHCEFLRLKRKIDLVQAKKNRQEKVVISAIEKILDEEFEEYQQQIDEKINKMNKALDHSKGRPLTEEETKEVKKTYRNIVKALHPDLHPDITPAQIQLFQNAVQAYENGDLNSLRIISEMVAEPVIPEKSENGLTVLAKEKERLSKTIELIREQITEIKSEYPYTMKDLVDDPEQIAKKKAELEETINELKEAYNIYAARLKEMLR